MPQFSHVIPWLSRLYLSSLAFPRSATGCDVGSEANQGSSWPDSQQSQLETAMKEPLTSPSASLRHLPLTFPTGLPAIGRNTLRSVRCPGASFFFFTAGFFLSSASSAWRGRRQHIRLSPQSMQAQGSRALLRFGLCRRFGLLMSGLTWRVMRTDIADGRDKTSTALPEECPSSLPSSRPFCLPCLPFSGPASWPSPVEPDFMSQADESLDLWHLGNRVLLGVLRVRLVPPGSGLESTLLGAGLLRNQAGPLALARSRSLSCT